MSTRAEERIGQVVDRYRIEALLGEGGFGAVYRARHIVMGRDVALKLLHAGTERDDAMRERFLREAQAAAAVGHRSIVQMFDCGITADGTAFIAMELLQGEDLEEHLNKHGPVSRQRAIQIMVDLLDGLEAAHRAGIVHRDLKPANIFLTGDGTQIKILDFGISQMRGQGIKNLTQTGMVMGTPHYMAPETFRGMANVDARADLYAVGAMLYQLIAGQPPHDAESYEQLVIRVATQPAPPLQQVVPDLPPDLARVVDLAVTTSPDHRWPSARAFREALLPYAAVTPPPRSVSADTMPATTPAGSATEAPTPAVLAVLAQSTHPPPSRSHGRLVLMGAISALVIGVSAAVAWSVAHESSPAEPAREAAHANAPLPPGVPPTPPMPPARVTEMEAATLPPDKPEARVEPVRAEAPLPAAPPPPLPPPAPTAPPAAVVTSVRVDLIQALSLPRAAALRFGDAAAPYVAACRRDVPHVVRVMMMVGPGGEIRIAQPDPNADHGDHVVASCVANRMGAQAPMIGADDGIAVYRVELPAR